MDHGNISLFLLLAPSVLCALSIFMIFLVKKDNRLLSRQLTETAVSVDQTRKLLLEIRDRQEKLDEFQDSLKMAALTTQLQKTRLQVQANDTDMVASDKYSSLQSLAQEGKSVEEIAATLTISTHEAQQLVNLSRLAQGNFAADTVT